MRTDSKPTEEQLKELYKAASDFKQSQPWKWLWDTDIICVENPKDKEIGYCSVMGRGGEHYALGVYLGTEGLAGFYDLMDNGDSVPYHQMLHFQDCLMCSFEDRDQLTNDDRKQIKDLELSFRGKNEWPMFRRFEPGYYPWYINQEECVFLTHALRETLFVATNVMTGQLRMNMEQGRTILRYSEKKGGKLEWYSKEIQLAIPKVSYSPVKITDDMLIQKIKRAGRMGDISLQVDTCYLPSTVQENKHERPYFPRILIVADLKSGMVVDLEMYQNITEDVNITLNKLIGFFLKNGIPREIQVRSERMVAILGDFCKKTDIKLKVVKRLASVDQVLDDMASRF